VPAPNDMRKWNLAMLRAYARRMARRPSRQVQALRQVSKRLGLVPQVYEWETTNSQGRHFWVDIRAGRMGKSLGPVYLDGTWDSIRRPPPAKNLEVLVAKAEHLEVLRLPYLIVAVHDRGEIELALRRWLRRLAASPSGSAFPAWMVLPHWEGHPSEASPSGRRRRA